MLISITLCDSIPKELVNQKSPSASESRALYPDSDAKALQTLHSAGVPKSTETPAWTKSGKYNSRRDRENLGTGGFKGRRPKLVLSIGDKGRRGIKRCALSFKGEIGLLTTRRSKFQDTDSNALTNRATRF